MGYNGQAVASAVLMMFAGAGFVLLGSGKIALITKPENIERFGKWRKFYPVGGLVLLVGGIAVGLIELLAK